MHVHPVSGETSLVDPAVMSSKVYDKSLRAKYLQIPRFLSIGCRMWYLLDVLCFYAPILKSNVAGLDPFYVRCGL